MKTGTGRSGNIAPGSSGPLSFTLHSFADYTTITKFIFARAYPTIHAQ